MQRILLRVNPEFCLLEAKPRPFGQISQATAKSGFKNNITFDLTEDAAKCNPSTPQINDAANWRLEDGESKLNVDGDAGTIDQLDYNALIVTSTETFGGLTIYTQSSFSH